MLRHFYPQLVEPAEKFYEVDGAVVIHVKEPEGICQFLELLVYDRPNYLEVSCKLGILNTIATILNIIVISLVR